MGAGGVGIIDPPGKGIVQLRIGRQHVPDKEAVRCIQHKFDDVIAGAELEFPVHAQVGFRLLVGGMIRENQGDQADGLHDDQCAGNALHYQTDRLLPPGAENDHAEQHREHDEAPDNQICCFFSIGQLHGRPGHRYHLSVQEQGLYIGRQPQPQRNRRSDLAGPGRKQHHQKGENQRRAEGDEQLNAPHIAEGEIEFAPVQQHDLHRGEENYRQREKKIAQQDRSPKPFVFVCAHLIIHFCSSFWEFSVAPACPSVFHRRWRSANTEYPTICRSDASWPGLPRLR